MFFWEVFCSLFHFFCPSGSAEHHDSHLGYRERERVQQVFLSSCSFAFLFWINACSRTLVLKIFISPYRLSSLAAQQRDGALLQVIFEDGKIGYGDCHPWPELGDMPLTRQIEFLRNRKLTPLTKRSLYYARIDAEARDGRRNLFANLSVPQSHLLIYDLLRCQLPDPIPEIVKIKVGRDPVIEIASLQRLFQNASKKTRFRLDANQRFDDKQCKKFLEQLRPWLDQIDFFEDPIPYEAGKWEEIQSEFSVPLASDLNSEQYLEPNYPHKISILKPACQDPEPFAKDFRQLIITSYLDHPLGQLAAAYTAAKAALEFPEKIGICGLLTHTLYEPNPFSERIRVQGARLIPPLDGYGFGYDDLLVNLKWEALA